MIPSLLANNCDSPLNIMARVVKDTGETWVFVYDDAHTDYTLGYLWSFAVDDRLTFNHDDREQLTKSLRERQRRNA